MAEALGAAVLTVSVDDTQLRAGLLAVQSEAQRTAAIVQQAFAQAAQAQQQLSTALARRPPEPPPTPPANAAMPWLKPSLPMPPPIPPELLRGINGAGSSSRSAAAAMDALRESMQRAQRTAPEFERVFGSIGGALRNVAALAGVVGIGALAQQFIATGTASQRADIQLQALAGAYGETEKAAAAVNRVQKVTGQSALEAATSFTQLYAALRGTGLNLEQIQVLFVGLNNAARLSGVGAAEAQSAFLQLRQALGSGRLQGDELGSVLEQLPALSEAIAKGLGTSVGQLRQLGSEGRITVDVIYGAVRSIATQAAPGRAAIDDIGIAFKTLQLEAAKALGPALTPLLAKAAAGFVALGAFIRDNKERLELFGRVTIQFAKSLAPLALGILAVRSAMQAYQVAVNAARVAQAGLLALSGPKGWLILGGAVAATAVAYGAIKASADAAGKAMSNAKVDALEALKEFLKLTDGTPAPGAGAQADPVLTAGIQKQIDLQNDLTRLEIQGINDKSDAARRLASLDGVELVRLQNKLAIQEKINERRRIEIQLQNELAKPRGAGDGQNGTQNLKTIADLEGGIAKVNAEIRAAYTDAGIALVKAAREAAAITAERLQKDRAFIDRIEGIRLDRAITRSGINSPIDVVDPATAAQEGRRRAAAAVTAELQPVIAARREYASLQQAALDAERRAATEKTTAARNAATDAAQAAAESGERLALAGDRFGQALKEGATAAGKELRDAQAGLNGVIRGNADVFSRRLVNEQLRLARAEIQPLVDRGVIRQGVPIRTPEQVFGLANIARQFTQAENTVALALAQKQAADATVANTTRLINNSTRMEGLTAALIKLANKNWAVNVKVVPPTAALPGV